LTPKVRPSPFRKKRANVLRGTLRGRCPSTCARIAEIMSEKAIFQQGLALTCKDLTIESEIEKERGIWSGA
jgi:hypothetical protein